jgi:hypothetical protein
LLQPSNNITWMKLPCVGNKPNYSIQSRRQKKSALLTTGPIQVGVLKSQAAVVTGYF